MSAALQTADFFDPNVTRDPYDFYKAARRDSPVVKVHHPELRQDIYLVLTYALIMEVTRKPNLYSSDFAHILFAGGSHNPDADAIIAAAPCDPTFLLSWDDPVHSHRRALVHSSFLPKPIAGLAASIEQIVDDLIDNFIERGECDFVNDFAIHLPSYVIADILRVPRTHYGRMKKWSDAILLRVGKMASKEQEIAAAHQVVEFREFILDMIHERRANPGDDILSQVINTKIEGETPLTDVDLMSFLQELLVGGNETTRNILIDGMARLLRHPNQLQLLRDDPSLMTNAVEELLRLGTPASAMWRVAMEDSILGGVHIPKGATISMRYDSANRDGEFFEDPDRFDIHRKKAKEHLSFSRGIHHCLGSHLAKKELNVAFTKLLSRLKNIRLVPENSDLTYQANMMIRAMRGLYIAFDPGERVGAPVSEREAMLPISV